jgi:hypothetical protein
LKWIKAQAEKYKPITRTDLQHYYETKYSRSVSRRCVDSCILRYCGDLTETKSIPQEYLRLKVLRTFLDETIYCLQEYVQGMKAELIFNLDKVRKSESQKIGKSESRNGKIGKTRK